MTTDAPQWVRVTLRMTRSALMSLAWFWAICLIAATVVTIVLAWRLGEPPFSIMSTVRYGGIWYPFSVGLILVTATINVHVAAGQTRRSFVIGSLLSGALAGLLSGVIMTVLLPLEAEVYLAQGWPHLTTSAAAIPEPWGTSLLLHCAIFVTGSVSGVLVGLTYYRWSAWATLALPLTVLAPVIASGMDGRSLTIAAIWAASAVTAVAAYVLARTIPIRKPLEMS
ncbi:hypothetical protein EXU48_23590 [Occultella glacieicola]|uniref:Uncharacterized protein n=1 Tax=Occultella glacieicola TaxID=2518684 RepID=A0ABY2DXM6_9MICO|nr:hypothetical protein [Occultella glacieicola]TDE88274.1 hypothetical protein EXU48_23590 [Occultella glacieicola]